MSTSLSMTSTGVAIRNRDNGDLFGVHDECLEKLTAMAPEAFNPFTGGFATVGPVFDEIKCAFKDCAVTA